MDVITAFLEECAVEGPGEVKAGDLYKEYTSWADENNEYKMSNTKFGKEVGLRYKRIRKSVGNVYEGLRIESNYNYGVDFGK